MRLISIIAGVILIGLLVAVFLVRSHTPPKLHIPKLPIRTDDPWILQTNDPKKLVGFNDAQLGPYLGNGYIGARIGPEGVGSFNGKPLPCLMAGFYENESLKALPNWSDFALYDSEDNRFVLDTDAPYRQTLDMRDGYVETELTLKSGRQRLVGRVTLFIAPRGIDVGKSPTISDTRATQLYAQGQGAVIRYSLIAKYPGAIRFDGLNVQFPKAGKLAAVVGNMNLFDDRVAEVAAEVVAGKPFRLTKILSVAGPARADVDPAVQDHLSDAASSKLAGAVCLGYDGLLRSTSRAWRNLWKSDIIIDGDPAAQQAVHAMMFYLLCSANPQTSIPPNGVSGAYFSGHIFWDADTWMFPALLLQHPELASGIVKYRLDTMGQAAQNAKARGLQGVEFAWESAATGKETSPASETREERHVTADAAIAASLASPPRFSVPGDIWGAWPESYGLVHLTAVYWASRVTYDKAKDRYEILKVCPPDENAGIVNNSVYTNAAAKRNIELAIDVAKKMGQSYPPKWDDIVKKMYIPFDQKDGRFLAYDGYKGGKTKQADTELLIYPLAYPMTDDVKARTFDFYKTTTDKRGPAMTSSIHAIIAAELGRPDEAYKHFLDSYQPFMRGPMLMFNEKRSQTYDNTCFLTGCGGTLQSVIYGFAGLRVGRAPQGFKQALPGLYIKPCLPPKWTKLQITGIKWQGKTYDLTVVKGNKWTLAPAK